MSTGLRARLQRRRPTGHHHLLTGSAVLVLGAAVQALTGSVFWLVAARLDDQADVGNATALYTSVLFVTYLAGLGLPVAVARYAADRSAEADTVFTWGLLATAASSLVFGIGYVAVVPAGAADVLTDLHPVGGPLLFAVLVVGAAYSLVVDVRFMTVRRWNLVLIRIIAVGLIRIPLLFALPDHDDRALWLFVFAAGPVAVSGFLSAAVLDRVTGGQLRLRPPPRTAAAVARYSAVNYVSTLAYQAPYFVLPVIVLAHVRAEVNASFYVAWGIVSVAFYVPSAIGQALLAEGGKDGAQLRGQLRLAMGLAVGLMGVGALGAFVGSDVVEAVYGRDYAEAARILPSLMAAGVPWAITSLYLTEARVRHRHVATVAITVALTGAIIVPALVLVPRHGIDGAGQAWLIGNIIAAVVAVTASGLSRRGRRLATDPLGDLPTTPTVVVEPIAG
ncbi:hypothetical protein BH20ACT2_BH20ACT2_04220 [soil metagenome]